MKEQTSRKIRSTVRLSKRPPFKSTRIVDDVFTDAVSLLQPRFEVNYGAYLQRLWVSNPEIYDILRQADSLDNARESLYAYLNEKEREVFEVSNGLHILEKATVRESVRVFKSIIGPVNEHRTGVSALNILWDLACKSNAPAETEISIGFLMEFIHLFRGVVGKSNIYIEDQEVKKSVPDFLRRKGRMAAELRTDMLDDLGQMMQKYFKRYPSGLEDEVINWRQENKARILSYFGGTDKDWNDYRWHLKNVIDDPQPILDLIELTAEGREAIRKAVQNNLPFGVTPYFLSLMDRRLTIGYDHAVRAQVIPPKEYVDNMVDVKGDRSYQCDFMGEHDTSPVDLVTRRYPLIAILKPYNTCAQICVYCQRNWEINRVLDPGAMASREKIDRALKWLDQHRSIGDVLITGGDPLIMKDAQIEHILESLAEMKHVYRIRLGTRTPVVMPMRWTDKLMQIVSRFHEPPVREIAVITHFEHSYEITPQSMAAVQGLKKAGISVYNQVVYTMENSRRFELTKLRRDLRSIGVDPYYTFNMKGKEETRRYMVPIARVLQERKEEARLLPGLDRTDEPVFNVPKLGKNHLRAWQDHRLVMIMPDGSRVYEFHPWEKNITPVPPYNHVDVPIYEYLEELAARGENMRDYRTIWYYY